MRVVASIDRFVDSNIICFLEKRLNETNLMDAILVLELQGPLAFPPAVKLIKIIYIFTSNKDINSNGSSSDLERIMMHS